MYEAGILEQGALQDRQFKSPIYRPLSVTTSTRPKVEVSEPDSARQKLRTQAESSSLTSRRQCAHTVQAGYAGMWDTLLCCCCDSTSSGATTAVGLQHDRPMACSSWPGQLQLHSYFASRTPPEQPSSCNSSLCSSQTGSLGMPCSSPASMDSSCQGAFCSSSGNSSYYESTPSSGCVTNSSASSMSTAYSTMSDAAGSSNASCWSDKSPHISSRPAPGGELGEGITWFMPEYGGREVLAEYEFGQTLGCGTFGVTRLVTHRQTARPWACKTICKASIATSPAAVSDVQHEVAILQHLSGHQGIVQLQGVFEDERNIHLVMELCTGGDLLDYISRFGKLSESEAADIGHVMLTTLQYCHENGVVHRDIKPENFLLGAPTMMEAPAGSAAAVLKISDFGVSAFHAPGESFAEIVGTPFYMAPEVLERCYGPAADIWSVGVVIYLMIAGCLPFNGNTDRQIIKAVMDSEPDFSSDIWRETSQSAKDFLKLLLVKNPSKRASINQLLAHPWMAGRGHSSTSRDTTVTLQEGTGRLALSASTNAALQAPSSSSSQSSCHRSSKADTTALPLPSVSNQDLGTEKHTQLQRAMLAVG